MAKHDVNIVIKARDEASKVMKRIDSSIRGLAGAAAAYFSVRAIKNFAAESLEAYGQQEAAINDLSAALGLLGDVGSDTMKDMEDFASGIQKITTYDDDAVMSIMALGASMGKLSGQQLKDATIATIGLSKAFKMDAVSAMRLVAKAAQGNTSLLGKYGIQVDATLTDQEKFNKVLEIGAEKFKLAEAETNTYLGKIQQMKNALGDVKETIGGALAPVVKELAGTIKTWAEDSQANIKEWAEKTVIALAHVADVIYGIKTAWEGLKLGGMKGAGNVARIAEDAKAIWKFIRGTDTAEAMKNQPKGGEKWSETIARVTAEQKKKFSQLLFDKALPSDRVAALFEKGKFKESTFGGGAGAGAGIGKDVRQQLRFREDRFLTFAPGARMDPAEQTAKSAARMVKLLEFIAKEQPKFDDLMNAIMPGKMGEGTVLVSAMQ